MNLTDRVSNAIDKAEAGDTKLTPDILGIPGLSGCKIQIVLNELCSYPDTRYFEIGINQGKTFCSAMYGNPGVGHACDNWPNAALATEATERIAKLGVQYQIHQCDCWSLDKSQLTDINVYFFDGGHSKRDHELAPIHFNECMADEWILLIDDWFTKTSDGTALVNELTCKVLSYAALETLEIVETWALGSGWDSDKEGYWNGLGVFVLRRG